MPAADQICDWTGRGSDKCGQPAVAHALWFIDDDEDWLAMACREHVRNLTRHVPDQTHRIEATCGLPGTEWDTSKNRCIIEGLDDLEIPAAEAIERNPPVLDLTSA